LVVLLLLRTLAPLYFLGDDDARRRHPHTPSPAVEHGARNSRGERRGRRGCVRLGRAAAAAVVVTAAAAIAASGLFAAPSHFRMRARARRRREAPRAPLLLLVLLDGQELTGSGDGGCG